MSEQSLQAEAPAQELAAVTEAISGRSEDAAPKQTDGAKEMVEKDDSVSDESSDADDGQESEPKELTEVDKVKAAMQKRIDRKTAVTKSLESKVQQLEQEKAELLKRAQKEAVTQDPEPQPDNFDTWEDYQNALVDFRAEQKVKKERAEMQRAQLEQKQQEIQRKQREAFSQKEAEFKKIHPDYDEKAEVIMDIAQDMQTRGVSSPTLELMARVMMEAPNAPALVYTLGANPELIDQIADMSPVEAAFEMFRLHEAYSRPKETKQAPAPISPTRASSSGSKPLSKRSGSEILEWVRS